MKVILRKLGKTKPKSTRNSAKANNIYIVSKINYDAIRKYIKVNINSTLIRLQIDTASDISIISEANWKNMGSPKNFKIISSGKEYKCRFYTNYWSIRMQRKFQSNEF